MFALKCSPVAVKETENLTETCHTLTPPALVPLMKALDISTGRYQQSCSHNFYMTQLLTSQITSYKVRQHNGPECRLNTADKSPDRLHTAAETQLAHF